MASVFKLQPQSESETYLKDGFPHPRLPSYIKFMEEENRRAKKVAVEEDSFKVHQGDVRKIKEDRTIKPEMQVAVFLRPVITIRRRGVMTFNRKPLMGWGL